MNAVELILELHKHDGTEPISRLAGLWYRRLDGRWGFWVNGPHGAAGRRRDRAKARAR